MSYFSLLLWESYQSGDRVNVPFSIETDAGICSRLKKIKGGEVCTTGFFLQQSLSVIPEILPQMYMTHVSNVRMSKKYYETDIAPLVDMTEILVVKISMISYLHLGNLCKMEPTCIRTDLNLDFRVSKQREIYISAFGIVSSN